MVLRKLDSYVQKNEIRTLPNTIQKDKLKIKDINVRPDKVKRQPSEWEKIIAKETTDKELIYKIYK